MGLRLNDRNITDRVPPRLAYLGGTPRFAEPCAVGCPNTVDREAFFARVEEILNRNWLTNNGPCVRELEARLAETLDVPECILVANGTVGLELAIKALELTGEVIVPAMTFVAAAHALQWCGVTPVFAEVDPATHSLDVDDVRRKITERTSGILGVHLWSRPCNIEGLQRVADEFSLSLLFDAAHAFGATSNGRRIGRFGDAEVFSFHATKFFSTLEGGAITTRNRALAERLRRMRNFGFSGLDCIAELGTNGKMNEVSAAYGLAMLPDVPELIARNRRVYRRYRENLRRVPHTCFVDVDEEQETNCQYVVVEVDDDVVDRDLVVEMLRQDNILARRYFMPGCHRVPPYTDEAGNPRTELPVTDALLRRVVCLPAGAQRTEADVDAICDVLRLAVEAASRT